MKLPKIFSVSKSLNLSLLGRYFCDHITDFLFLSLVAITQDSLASSSIFSFPFNGQTIGTST